MPGRSYRGRPDAGVPCAGTSASWPTGAACTEPTPEARKSPAHSPLARQPPTAHQRPGSRPQNRSRRPVVPPGPAAPASQPSDTPPVEHPAERAPPYAPRDPRRAAQPWPNPPADPAAASASGTDERPATTHPEPQTDRARRTSRPARAAAEAENPPVPRESFPVRRESRRTRHRAVGHEPTRATLCRRSPRTSSGSRSHRSHREPVHGGTGSARRRPGPLATHTPSSRVTARG
jgi:hypothetical protein